MVEVETVDTGMPEMMANLMARLDRTRRMLDNMVEWPLHARWCQLIRNTKDYWRVTKFLRQDSRRRGFRYLNPTERRIIFKEAVAHAETERQADLDEEHTV